jgi:Domain of unknown function (DUF4331)
MTITSSNVFYNPLNTLHITKGNIVNPTRNQKMMKLAIAAATTAIAASSALPVLTYAASHREAPMVAGMPRVDSTDVYVFKSYEPGRSGFVTILANYIPLQDAYGGPNYFNLDNDAVYEIHIDQNGDAREDLTFQFKFNDLNKNIALNINGKKMPIPLVNIGPTTDVNGAALNATQTFTVTALRGPRRNPTGVGFLVNAANGSRTFNKPVDNIGTRSFPDYKSYASKHIYNVSIPGCSTPAKLFVGQRKDGFGVRLGDIFDLLNIPTAEVIGSRNDPNAFNVIDDKNVTTLGLELPIACITTPQEPVIGVWTTASLPQSRLVADLPLSRFLPFKNNLVQVSRMGAPLVNEVVIGLPDKDKFSNAEPKDDGQFADYVTNPTLPAIVEVIYGADGVRAPTVFPRTDLVAAFLTGVPGVNSPANVRPSEMLRLNTALPATAKGSQNSLGAAGCFLEGKVVVAGNANCDPAGFPNGRRPGDDVVDIALRVVMGTLLPPGNGKPGSADLPYTDGVLVEDSQFDNSFPYLTTPIPGGPGLQPAPKAAQATK